MIILVCLQKTISQKYFQMVHVLGGISKHCLKHFITLNIAGPTELYRSFLLSVLRLSDGKSIEITCLQYVYISATIPIAISCKIRD